MRIFDRRRFALKQLWHTLVFLSTETPVTVDKCRDLQTLRIDSDSPMFAGKGNCNEMIPYINGGSDGCRSRMSGNDRAGGWHGI